MLFWNNLLGAREMRHELVSLSCARGSLLLHRDGMGYEKWGPTAMFGKTRLSFGSIDLTGDQFFLALFLVSIAEASLGHHCTSRHF